LGPLWLFINPLISSFTYMVVFGGIAGLSTDGIPQMSLVAVLLIYYIFKGVVAPHWVGWLFIPIEIVHLGLFWYGTWCYYIEPYDQVQGFECACRFCSTSVDVCDSCCISFVAAFAGW
jgi:hypothetical protein